MSAENFDWLNNHTYIGCTDYRGRAWHDKAEARNGEDNHYPGFIPPAEIMRRMLDWTPVEAPITATVGDTVIADTERKAIIRPPFAFGDDDEGGFLGVVGKEFAIHGVADEIMAPFAALETKEFGFTSAGQLKGGAVTWLEMSALEEFEYGGVKYRPNLLGVTGVDGTLATCIKNTVTMTVCDNTMAAALGEKGGESIKVKHTKHSVSILRDRMDGMEIIQALSAKVTEQLDMLLNTTVTGEQVEKFLDVIYPLPSEDGRGKTRRENIRSEYHTLLNSDPRVHPWQGTAWGLMAAHNTYSHHLSPVRGGDDKRIARNNASMIMGGFDKVDAEGRKAVELALA